MKAKETFDPPVPVWVLPFGLDVSEEPELRICHGYVQHGRLYLIQQKSSKKPPYRFSHVPDDMIATTKANAYDLMAKHYRRRAEIREAEAAGYRAIEKMLKGKSVFTG